MIVLAVSLPFARFTLNNVDSVDVEIIKSTETFIVGMVFLVGVEVSAVIPKSLFEFLIFFLSFLMFSAMLDFALAMGHVAGLLRSCYSRVL